MSYVVFYRFNYTFRCIYIVFNELLQPLFTDSKFLSAAKIVVEGIAQVYFRAVFHSSRVTRISRTPIDLGSVCSPSIHPHPCTFFFYVTEPHPHLCAIQRVFDESMKNKKMFEKDLLEWSAKRKKPKLQEYFFENNQGFYFILLKDPFNLLLMIQKYLRTQH